MTLVQKTFDSQASGTAATTSNTGASSVNALSGGTVTFDSGVAARGSTCGLKMAATGSSSAADIRYTIPANSKYATTLVVTSSNASPSASITLLTLWASGSRALTVFLSTAGKFGIIDGAGVGVSPVMSAITAGARYRLGLVVDNSGGTSAGKVTFNVYTETGTTALGSTSVTNMNLLASPIDQLRLGATLWPTEGASTGFDDVQWDDGATTEIDGISAASASIRPAATSANPGAWVTDSGATTGLAAAVADESDATYVTSPSNPVNASVTFSFNVPLASGSITVKTRGASDLSSPVVSRLVELLQGSSVMSSQTYTLSTTVTDHSWTLSSTEMASITDRSNLFVRVTDTAA